VLQQERPPPSICCIYMVVDVLGQFVVHMGVLVTCIDMTRPLLEEAWVCSADSSNSTLALDEGSLSV
jgi:hypothetical protein